ncbi:hypothetical protein GCM10012275_14630 [Longimycelium tulufanense]|uniref:Uncharacterized protein n=1 Tax=Longimycelium tulufanense TaxID=907463 RepID=A0A8J3FTV9_9PSEU|nr:hypothetical protein GCM10012275_14630 [Longimycelium tulufanense]
MAWAAGAACSDVRVDGVGRIPTAGPDIRQPGVRTCHAGLWGNDRAGHRESHPSRAAEIRAAAKHARSVEILAVRGLGILALNDSLLHPAVLGGGCQMRVLLLEPDSRLRPIERRRWGNR